MHFLCNSKKLTIAPSLRYHYCDMSIFIDSNHILHIHGRPQLFWKGGARIVQGGRHLTAVNTLSAFGRFNEGGVAVRFQPIQQAGEGGGGLSTFSRFNERGRGGGGGAVRFRPILSVRCPLSWPIQSFNQWAKDAELLLQWGGAMPPLGTHLWHMLHP